MDIYISNINEKSIEVLLKYVSNEKKNKIYRFVKNEDKIRTLLGEALLRSIVCKKFHVKNKEIQIFNTTSGKPFLKLNNNFHFNISHSGEWVILVIDNNKIGVDIEKIQPIEYIEIAKNFFQNKEYEDILGEKQENRLDRFFRIWTLKESYIKAEGLGLTIPLNSFTVDIKNQNNIQVIDKNNSNKWCLKEFYVAVDYKVAICSLNSNFPNEVIELSQYDIIDNLI